MEYRWTFRTINAQRWELILVERYDSKRVIRVPGYESRKFRDIMEAYMYLNNGFKGHLSEREMHLLEQIRQETEIVLQKT